MIGCSTYHSKISVSCLYGQIRTSKRNVVILYFNTLQRKLKTLSTLWISLIRLTQHIMYGLFSFTVVGGESYVNGVGILIEIFESSQLEMPIWACG